MDAINAKVGERYLNNKGTPVTIVGVKGDKVILKIANSDNEIPVAKTYALKPFSQAGVSREAKILSHTNGKAPGKNGRVRKEGSLAAVIDPYLYAGGKTVAEIAKLVTKKAAALAKGRDMKANVRARLHHFKKAGVKIEKNDKRHIKVIQAKE